MLQVEHLTKRYGAVTAVDDLSFRDSGRGGLRLPRAQRGGEEHHHEHHDGLPLRHGGDGENLRV